MAIHPSLFAALLAAGLAGCAAADVQVTSPLRDVRVTARGQTCDTPCTLRLPAFRRTFVKAYDPAGRIDFTYEIRPDSGAGALEVLGR